MTKYSYIREKVTNDVYIRIFVRSFHEYANIDLNHADDDGKKRVLGQKRKFILVGPFGKCSTV